MGDVKQEGTITDKYKETYFFWRDKSFFIISDWAWFSVSNSLELDNKFVFAAALQLTWL